MDNNCVYCGEPCIIGKERIRRLADRRLAHGECLLRQVIGSLAHLEKRCSCFVPGSTEGDPDGMSLREAAKAAAEAYEKLIALEDRQSWLVDCDE